MKFTKDHEWIKVENGIATIGISQYAADALGELVFVELPEINSNFNKGDSFAVVESSKSASDVYCPISGEITEINEDLNSQPELINNSPYENGWIAKIKISDESALNEMMDESQYNKHLEEIS
ncbi:glycine cleavage system protein GcvH [Rickettsiales bacterium]|jgi:glycine cleavage system H protein|nr:glycine cleavage system protein GcvH [Rickettsiales bacterium]